MKKFPFIFFYFFENFLFKKLALFQPNFFSMSGSYFPFFRHYLVPQPDTQSMDKIFEQIQKFAKITNDYFNPVGKLYLKYQIVTRIVFFQCVLDDVITTDIICDTLQFGCEEMCRNRFSPIRMEKIYTRWVCHEHG